MLLLDHDNRCIYDTTKPTPKKASVTLFPRRCQMPLWLRPPRVANIGQSGRLIASWQSRTTELFKGGTCDVLIKDMEWNDTIVDDTILLPEQWVFEGDTIITIKFHFTLEKP